MKEQLFKDDEAVGEYVKLNGISFKVVGVFDDVHEGETKRMYIPYRWHRKHLFLKTGLVL